MATHGSAAAALLKAALPKNPVASTSNTPDDWKTGRGGGARMSIRGRGVGRGRIGGDTRRNDDDVGMDVDDGTGTKRRGRTGARPSPMGDRPLMRVDGKPYNPRKGTAPRNAPNAPRIVTENAGSVPRPLDALPTSIETIRLFLMARYSPEAKLLNLENMASDTVLQTAGVLAPGQKGAAKDISGVIWKLAGTLFPNIESLSLANNSLTSLLPLSPYLLTTFLPNLQNVSLASNSLARLRDLDPLSPVVGKARGDNKSKGWKTLRELVLTGNPMVETGAGELDYRRQIARRFPSIRQLDQKPLDPSIAFVSSATTPISDLTPGLSSAAKRDQAKSKREPTVFPVKVLGGFFESDGTRDFVAGFFMKFFAAYDNDRPSLEAAYAPVCTFSFFVDTTYPMRSKAKKIGGHGDKKFPHQHNLDWRNYLTPDGSRNLQRVKNPAKRVATLKTTPSAVVGSIKALPQTMHPLSDAQKFVFDTWTMPGLLAPAAPGAEGETIIFAVVHGEFTELPSKGIRSFDRTFTLAPAPPGSPYAAPRLPLLLTTNTHQAETFIPSLRAHLAGWPCIILSDSLSIRGYTDPSVWTPKVPQAPPTVAAVPTSLSAPLNPVVLAPIQERADGLTDPQQAIVLELAALTNLTYTFAHLCLVQNGWDPIVALSNFQALHASGAIPPEAFRQV